MVNNLEIEYKLLISHDEFEKLSSFFPKKTFIRQTNTYYDTRSEELKKQGCALRIREKEGKFLITLKTPAASGHHEYECYVDENNASVFKNCEIKNILDGLHLIDDFIETGQCVTDRAVFELDQAELCFDINFYNGITDYEIEYEQMTPHDGITEFNKILALINKTFIKNCDSKVKRTLNSQCTS